MFLYVDVRHVESLRRVWRRSGVDFHRLGGGVAWPPVQPAC